MSLLLAYGALGGFLVLLAGLVLAARPASPANRALAALLVLEGASNFAYELMRGAPTEESARFHARLGAWYSLPYIALTLGVLGHVFGPPLSRRARRNVFLLGALATAALAALLVAWEPLFIAGILQDRTRDGASRMHAHAGPVAVALGWAKIAIDALAVLLAARAASAPAKSVIERKRAALVGLAFVIPLGHASMSGVLAAVLPTASAPLVHFRDLALFVPSLAGLAVVLPALPRIARALDGRARSVAWAAGTLPLAAGVWDGSRGLLSLLGVSMPIDYGESRYVWLAAFAVTLSLALLRYGLAGLGDSARRRVAIGAAAGLAVAAVALPAGLALALSGVTTLGLGATLFVALAALAISPVSLGGLGRRAARALLLDPSDPAAAAERTREYRARAARHLDGSGRLTREGEEELAALRAELGVPEDSHPLLVERARAERDAPPLRPTLLGRYRVDREIGRGAFATAVLATDLLTGDRVVLKRFHAGRSAGRAVEEARALQAVRHPRVVPLLSIERAGAEVFLVLGYAAGGSLHDAVEREGPLPPDRAVALALDYLEGLAFLHSRGLVHGDVKAGNVLLDGDGRALLGDLGAARSAEPAELPPEGADATLTAGQVVGSLATIAPEVLMGAEVSPASDVYGAGAVLYTLLTGEDYVEVAGKSLHLARHVILRSRPRLPHPRVPPGVEPVLANALAKEPRDRYAHAGEMRDALLPLAPASVAKEHRG